MLSKRATTLCKIILQLTIITNKMYAILGGLKSGGLMSRGLKSYNHIIWCGHFSFISVKLIPACNYNKMLT